MLGLLQEYMFVEQFVNDIYVGRLIMLSVVALVGDHETARQRQYGDQQQTE